MAFGKVLAADLTEVSVKAVAKPRLSLTLQYFRFLGFLLIFLYNAKPSFEIAKWMAKDMLWQNMKINKILQKT